MPTCPWTGRSGWYWLSASSILRLWQPQGCHYRFSIGPARCRSASCRCLSRNCWISTSGSRRLLPRIPASSCCLSPGVPLFQASLWTEPGKHHAAECAVPETGFSVILPSSVPAVWIIVSVILYFVTMKNLPGKINWCLAWQV